MDPVRERVRVVLISPLKQFTVGGTTYTMEDNIKEAEHMCLLLARGGLAPFAPHGFYTRFLDDTLGTDREIGMDCGLAWLEAAQAAVVRGPANPGGGMIISSGMAGEIEECSRTGIPVFFWDPAKMTAAALRDEIDAVVE